MSKLKKLKFPQITGESIIPVKLYVIQIPTIIIFSVLADAESENLNELSLKFLAAINSVIVTLFFVLFYKFVIFGYAKDKPIPFRQILLYILLLGSIKGGSYYFFYVIFNIHSHGFFHYHLVLKILSATFTAAWFVPTTSWIYISLKKYKDLRNNLMTQSIQLKLENLSYKKLIEESKLTLKNNISQVFKDIKQQIDLIENKTFESEWIRIAELVRSTALNKIRPKSHELWVQPKKEKEKYLSLFFIKSAIQLNPFPWQIVIPVYVLTSLIHLFINFENFSLIMLLNGSLIIFVMYSLGNFINKYSRQFKFITYLSVLSLTSILFLINAQYSLKGFDPEFVLVTAIIGNLWFIVLSLFSSLVTTVRVTKDNLIKEVEDSLNEQRVHKATLSQLEKRINVKLSKFLHGYVQARLMSNALQLENASKNQDLNLASAELDKLSQDIYDDYGILDQLDFGTSFVDALEKIKASWAGICEIEILGYKNLKIDQMIIKDFIQDAIAEAISNSVRHGQATKIQILFNNLNEKTLQISVKDDGIGPEKSNPGMGSEIFNILCGKNWELLPNVNGMGSVLILNVDTSLDQNVSGIL